VKCGERLSAITQAASLRSPRWNILSIRLKAWLVLRCYNLPQGTPYQPLLRFLRTELRTLLSDFDAFKLPGS
jgi:hypothetical protein